MIVIDERKHCHFWAKSEDQGHEIHHWHCSRDIHDIERQLTLEKYVGTSIGLPFKKQSTSQVWSVRLPTKPTLKFNILSRERKWKGNGKWRENELNDDDGFWGSGLRGTITTKRKRKEYYSKYLRLNLLK